MDPSMPKSSEYTPEPEPATHGGVLDHDVETTKADITTSDVARALDTGIIGVRRAFFLMVDKFEVSNTPATALGGAVSVVLLALLAVFAITVSQPLGVRVSQLRPHHSRTPSVLPPFMIHPPGFKRAPRLPV